MIWADAVISKATSDAEGGSQAICRREGCVECSAQLHQGAFAQTLPRGSVLQKGLGTRLWIPRFSTNFVSAYIQPDTIQTGHQLSRAMNQV